MPKKPDQCAACKAAVQPMQIMAWVGGLRLCEACWLIYNERVYTFSVQALKEMVDD